MQTPRDHRGAENETAGAEGLELARVAVETAVEKGEEVKAQEAKRAADARVGPHSLAAAHCHVLESCACA